MTNNQRLTDEELAEIRERSEMAAAGPWELADTTEGAWIIDEEGDIISGTCESTTDAVFIAHAREDIPKLIAEVEYRREKQAELLEYNRQYFAEIKRLRAEIARLEMEAMK